MKKGLKGYVLCLSIILTSCTLYQKPTIPVQIVPEQLQTTVDRSLYPSLNNHWWENFNDPDLNVLVEKAIVNNNDYLITLKNIDIAQTYVLQNMTQLFPQLGLDFETSRNKGLANVGDSASTAPQLTTNQNVFNLQTLTATVSYELDIWNQVHNSVNQAKADKETIVSNADVIRLTLVSAVVNTYYQMTALSENITNLRKQHKAAVEIQALREVQLESGLVDEEIVYLARNQAEEFYSAVKLSEKQLEIVQYSLAFLLGEYPEQFVFKPTHTVSSMKLSGLLPESIPSTMLATRPDIQGAFSSVMSFGYVEKQNIANFLPSLSLSGTYGYANNTLANLINSSNAVWNYGLSALQVVIDYPALYSQWKRSQIQFESSVLAYKNTLIKAFTEVDGAIVSYKKDKKVNASYQRKLDNSRELVGIAKAHYTSGLSDYIDYLDNKVNFLQSKIDFTHQQLIVIQDIVQVYKTLGLGIDEQPPSNG